MSFHVPNLYRVRTGPLGSSDAVGNKGAFSVVYYGEELRIIANDASLESEYWEHVSVSARRRCPTWEEMCYVKSLFWDDEDRVLQMHPPKSEYVNVHPHCLHLWRHTALDITARWPMPHLVG